jgi:mannose-6-phosphate isomerase-like protein (cupin superfamily)
MEHLKPEQFVALSNPGVTSLQLLSPLNSSSSRLTITRVTVAPGAAQSRHVHASSEQVWYALAGEGTLLLADGARQPFAAGQVVRFVDGEVHGVENTGNVRLEYLSVTAPPIDFTGAYERKGT